MESGTFLNNSNNNKDGVRHKAISPFYRNIKEVRKRYASTFTMHAMEHIINGTLVEKIFWTFKLMLALAVAIILSKKLFVSFFDHEVNTKITLQTNNRLQFPMILIGGHNTGTYLYSRNNCTSNQSISYRDISYTADGEIANDICEKLQQQCPNLPVAKITAVGMGGGRVRGKANISCDVFGQFVAVNGDGALHQSHSTDSMEVIIFEYFEYRPDFFKCLSFFLGFLKHNILLYFLSGMD